MCGFAGFYQPGGFSLAEAELAVTDMRDRLLSRGPSDAGKWLDSNFGIAMGHRRLSILDRTPAGHQPMVSTSGRFILVFNGEIYNHLELRRQLEITNCVTWRGYSDTETLLAAIDCWGFDKTLQVSVGMFALALWDRRERSLSLARDRLGEKPLYYGWQKGILLFGSELKALQAHPEFQFEIDRSILPLYLRHGYVPAPWCINKGIRKLLPGTWVSYSVKDCGQLREPVPYWSLTNAALDGQLDPFKGTEDEAVEQLGKLLTQAIAGQSVADVPIGTFLSGGVDSTIITALTQAQSSKPVKTFTIGFEHENYNEAKYAEAVAKYLGTDHTELYVTSAEAQQVIPRLPEIFDEPFGDTSSISTSLVSQLAHQTVQVTLTGDGGDELFGGYEHYLFFKRLLGRMSYLSFSQRRRLSSILGYFCFRNGGKNHRRQMKLLKILNSREVSEQYLATRGFWLEFDDVLMNTDSKPFWPNKNGLLMGEGDPINYAMLADQNTFLPDDILVKVDRAAMAFSLETRAPLLDHRIVEWSWRLPQRFKTGEGASKKILRELLYKNIPRELVDRPKMGFAVPISDWLRGPLRDWAEHLLEQHRIHTSGYLNNNPIQQKWREHLAGSNVWESHLWIVLMFQASKYS